MNEPTVRSRGNENKRMLWWFLIALVIALLPWLLLAQDAIPKDDLVKTTKKEKSAPHCQRVCTMLYW
jgi:hypothetical protein